MGHTNYMHYLCANGDRKKRILIHSVGSDKALNGKVDGDANAHTQPIINQDLFRSINQTHVFHGAWMLHIHSTVQSEIQSKWTNHQITPIMSAAAAVIAAAVASTRSHYYNKDKLPGQREPSTAWDSRKSAARGCATTQSPPNIV